MPCRGEKVGLGPIEARRAPAGNGSEAAILWCLVPAACMCGGTVGEEEGIKILISKAEGFDYRGWHGEIRLVQCYEETV